MLEQVTITTGYCDFCGENLGSMEVIKIEKESKDYDILVIRRKKGRLDTVRIKGVMCRKCENIVNGMFAINYWKGKREKKDGSNNMG